MRHPPDPSYAFSKEAAALPLSFPNPNVTLPKDQLQSFRDSFVELGQFLAALIGVEWRTMTTFDMLKFRYEHEQRLEKIKDYEALILKYAAAPDTHWTSGGPGYDPASGWTGSVSGSYVTNPEAKELVKKWGLK